MMKSKNPSKFPNVGMVKLCDNYKREHHIATKFGLQKDICNFGHIWSPLFHFLFQDMEMITVPPEGLP